LNEESPIASSASFDGEAGGVVADTNAGIDVLSAASADSAASSAGCDRLRGDRGGEKQQRRGDNPCYHDVDSSSPALALRYLASSGNHVVPCNSRQGSIGGRDQLDRGRAFVYLYADRWEVAVSIFKTCAARARFPVVMALIAFCVSRPMSAQPANERAVRAVADSFFAAIARERWDSAAALLDLTGFEPYFKDRVSSA
jgi:hypothetical protein